MINIKEAYEVVKTFQSRTGNIVHIAKLRRENTLEEINDFYKAFVKIMLENEGRINIITKTTKELVD